MHTENTFILEQAEKLFGVALVKENTMGNSGSKIFEVKTEKNEYILRASELSAQKQEHTVFELRWMEYLANHISGVVRPIRSLENNICEVIEVNNKSFILCVTEKANGKLVNINNPNEFNEELFFRLGALMGEMHRLTMDYKGNISKPEFEWTGFVNAWRYDCVILDEDVRLAFKHYYDKINTLPKGKDSYGIIHYDIHTDNFFVDNNGNIKLFDFDACQFNWYAADIASAVFFMIQKGAGPLTDKTEKERTEFAETYLTAYLKGYLETNTISAYWVKKIELFMKFQMWDEYISVQNFWPDELMHLQDYYMSWHKERIVNGLPYAFIDYEKVINSLPKLRG